MKIPCSTRRFLAVGLVAGFALGAVIDKAVSEINDYRDADKPDMITVLDRKMAGIGETLARQEAVGYLSDGKREDLGFLAVQYAITPVRIEPGSGQRFVIACFLDPMTEADFHQRFGLELVEDLGDGIYLLKGEGG